MTSARLLKRLAWGLGTLIVALFVFVTVVVSRPAYDEHAALPSPGTTWPDGSVRTANDWWAHSSPVSHAQSPAQPSPKSG